MSGKIEISRQLAERLLNFTCNEEYDELRALLAGPVVDRQEPVAADIALDKAYRNGMMAGFSFGIRGDEDGYAKAIEQYDAEIHAAKTEPPEPPAPVAVVLPERGGLSNRPNFNEGWNACLDKVKELNQ